MTIKTDYNAFYILLHSVKKILTYMSCMLAVMIIIAHDSIHHHHTSAGNIEVVNTHDHQEDDHHDDGDHFPPHQHILADADFFPVRNVFLDGKILKHIQIEFTLVDPSPVNKINLLIAGFIWVFKDPPSLQAYSLTPNLTRGSPSLS